jgi:Carboxypeptidase regulatory-like domain
MKRSAIHHLVKQPALKGIVLSFIIICLTTIKGFTQIQGGVFDQKKSGISNALVIASDTSGKVIDSVRSDKRGFYMFNGLTSGKYRIEAKAMGFLPSVHDNIVANKEYPFDVNTRNDISNATRLEIILKPENVSK